MIVFDFDGTLSDCTHRVPLVPDWDAFYEACDKDEPIRPVIEVYSQLHHAGHRVEIWTGRRESTRDKTLGWLENFLIPAPHRLLMRADGDHREDVKIKKEWLDAARVKPAMVFEDRRSVVDMYREHGIIVFQVAPGEF